ncbi:putative membrane lipoprotein [Wolffia australiana]
MEKKLTLLQTVFTAGVFSAVSCWYGFMFGRESARKELEGLIEELRRDGNPSGIERDPHSER